MRIRKTMLSFLLISVGLAGCINDADISDVNTSIDDKNGNIKFLVETPAINALTKSAETSEDYESGTENEYAVKKLDVYMFNSSTKMFVKSLSFNNLTHSTGTGDISTNSPDEATIYYQTEAAEVEPGTYDFFAVANAESVYAGLTNEDEFINRIDATTYSQGSITSAPERGFLMTNRAVDNRDVTVGHDNSGTKTTIEFSMERAVAKIEIAKSSSDYDLVDNNGMTYATINLSNYKVVNLPSRFYTFRHVAVLTELTKPDFKIETNFGNVPSANGYVIDPYFFNKKVESGDFDNADGYYKESLVELEMSSNWSSMPSVGGKSSLYSLENCMIQDAQKNAYTTGVVFKSSVNPSDNVYELKDNELVKTSNRVTKMYYFNYNFYNSLAALKKAGVANIDVNKDYTDKELSAFSVKQFSKNQASYECYYNYWIKHLDNQKPTEMGVMEYGIVRNNLYRLKIAGISGLGTGTPSIDPENPDEPNSYIDVAVEVKPWIVRSQEDINL